MWVLFWFGNGGGGGLGGPQLAMRAKVSSAPIGISRSTWDEACGRRPEAERVAWGGVFWLWGGGGVGCGGVGGGGLMGGGGCAKDLDSASQLGKTVLSRKRGKRSLRRTLRWKTRGKNRLGGKSE